jgi:hypothetical protein
VLEVHVEGRDVHASWIRGRTRRARDLGSAALSGEWRIVIVDLVFCSGEPNRDAFDSGWFMSSWLSTGRFLLTLAPALFSISVGVFAACGRSLFIKRSPFPLFASLHLLFFYLRRVSGHWQKI